MDQDRADRIQMIRDSASAVIPADGSLARVRALRFGERDFDSAVWRDMVELGWPALLVAEEAGGIGLGMGEYVALAEALGRGLVPEPFVAVASIAPVLGDLDRATVLSGARIIIPALGSDVAARAGRLSGRCNGLLSGRAADGFLVAVGDEFWSVDACHVSVTSAVAQDGRSIATITLVDAPGHQTAEDVMTMERLTLGVAAELLGVAMGAFDITLNYLRTRHQFGRAIGGFQALQHRCADLLVQIELARAAIESAALALDVDRSEGQDRNAIRRAVSRAKARAAEMAMLVTRQGIQLHGGIGFADESDIGLYLRRAMVLVNQGGSADWHRKRYGALIAG